MKHTAYTFLLSLLALVLVSGCASTRSGYPDPRYPFPRTEEDRKEQEKERERREKERDKEWEKRDKDKDRDWEGNGRDRDRRDRDGRTYPFSDLKIPKGHLPPPGGFPGKPPGHQPPPQSCASALRNAPLGAWVITHEGSRYKVNIFNRSRQNVIDEVRYYQAK